MPTFRRLTYLFHAVVAVAALSACGGGGGDNNSPGTGGVGAPVPSASPAPAAGGLTYAQCTATPPLGSVNTFINSSRPRREWQLTHFLGETVTGRVEFPSGSSNPTRIRYSKTDFSTGAVTVLGLENYDVSGNLLLREQYTGWVIPAALSEGQSQATDYTVKTLFPAGRADRQERVVRTYLGNQVVNLTGGRLDTCSVRDVVHSVSGGVATPISIEQLNYAKGAGWVKSYFTSTGASASDRNQTYLVELASSTVPLSFAAPKADTAPSLASCSAVALNQTLRFSANNATQAGNALRQTRAGTFNGGTVLTVDRRQATTQVLSQRFHFDAAAGLLRQVGRENLDAAGSNVAQAFVKTGVPDLRTLALGATVDYTATSTYYLPSASTSNGLESVTFLGHEKVTTPAGTFDTCKVRFIYGQGSTSFSETYNYAPGLYWVRYDEASSAGARTVRELLTPAP